MQKKSNIVSKLVLSTAAALMGVGATAGATEQPDIQESAQLANFLAEVGETFSVDSDGVEYKVDSKGDKKTASICDYDSSKISKNLTLKEKAEDASDSTEYDVTKINAEAFKDCTKIETVGIPASVTDIGKNAFDGCSNLKVLHIAGDSDHLGAMKLDPKFLGSADLESVYVDVETLSTDARKALVAGVSENIIRQNISGLDVGSVASVESTVSDDGVKIDWTTNATDGAVDTYMILRQDKETGKTEAVGLVANKFGVPTEFVDSTAEFGKTYTYSVAPCLIDPYYETATAAELYTASKYDEWGIVDNTPVPATSELTVDQKSVNGILHYYSDGELYTPVQNRNLTCVQGLDTQSWYVLDNSKNVYKTTNTTGETQNLYVREWDLAEENKDDWDNLKLDAISKDDLAAKEYRVFSLNVKDDTGKVVTDDSLNLGTTDDTLQPSSYAVYLELSKNMDPDSVRVVIANDSGLDYVYGDKAGEIEIVKSLPNSNAPKSEYGFAKIMLDSALPGSTQPFVMYADKIENSSSSSDSTDKKEENKNNSSNGSTSGSKGYATGDVAGFGMLHAAYSMLAAAGSTLLGLFRKKK